MSDIEILASDVSTGDYGFRCETRLVRRKAKHYLVAGGYCGEGSLRGGAVRNFVYEVPDSLVSEIIRYIEHPSDPVDESNYNLGTCGSFLRNNVIGDLRSLGEQGNLKWTDEL